MKINNKIKKLIPKIGKWSLWIGLGLFCVYVSINSFLRLHDGASIQDVDGRKYAPVINEVLLMIGATIFLLFLLKITTKIRTTYIVAIGVILTILISWFGNWAFKFTHQDPVEGLLTILIIIGSVIFITVTVLFYEWRKRRRKSRRS